MIQVIGTEFKRGGEKIGWIERGRIFDRSGRELGYVENYHIHDASRNKIGYIEGDYLHGSNTKIRLTVIHEEIQGGALTELERCAVRLLLGD